MSYADGTLSITQRPITVTVDASSKTYGSTDPLLTYQLSNGNLIGSDVLGGALRRKAGETVGSYSIDASGLSHGNYQITARNGVFTIMPQSAYSPVPVPVIQPESVVSSSPTSSLLAIPVVIFESQQQSLANPQSAR